GQPFCDTGRHHLSHKHLADAAAPVEALPEPAPAQTPVPAGRIQDRYELLGRLGERLGVERFKALDHGDGGAPAVSVVVVRQALSEQPADAAPLPGPE